MQKNPDVCDMSWEADDEDTGGAPAITSFFQAGLAPSSSPAENGNNGNNSGENANGNGNGSKASFKGKSALPPRSAYFVSKQMKHVTLSSF